MTTTTSTTPRIIAFEGARNVRDLGGLPVAGGRATRHGVIYRADGLSRLTDLDLEILAALELRTIIDLRYDAERERARDRVPPGTRLRIVERGMFPQGSHDLLEGINELGADGAGAFELMRRNYARIPLEHTEDFRAILHELLQPDAAPHLIHCTSGKDRTGIVVALILRAVGVDVETVLADYELSNCEHQAVDVFAPQAHPEAVAMVMAAHADYLLAALEAIDAACGSIDAYLAQHLGFTDVEREALRALLVE